VQLIFCTLKRISVFRTHRGDTIAHSRREKVTKISENRRETCARLVPGLQRARSLRRDPKLAALRESNVFLRPLLQNRPSANNLKQPKANPAAHLFYV
jgi:hypothetical protein